MVEMRADLSKRRSRRKRCGRRLNALACWVLSEEWQSPSGERPSPRRPQRTVRAKARRGDRKGARPPSPQVGNKLWREGTPRKGKSWDGKHLGCGGTHLLFAKGCGRRPSSEAPAKAGIRGRPLRTRFEESSASLTLRLRCSYRSRRGWRDMRCSSRSGWGEASTMSDH